MRSARCGRAPSQRGGSGRRGALRRRIPAALLLTGMTVLVLALARPQSVIGVPRFEGTVILSFDVSGSMAATDMDPSRMEAAKAAARTFVARQPPTILIGIVAFSDTRLLDARADRPTRRRSSRRSTGWDPNAGRRSPAASSRR